MSSWYGFGGVIDGDATFNDDVTIVGQLKLSTSGSTAGLLIGGDAHLYRYAANVLALGLDDSLASFSSLSTIAVFQTYVTGDTNPRISITADGKLNLGSGSAAGDVTLERTAANQFGLGTGDDFLLPTTSKHLFRDAAIHIASLTDGHLDLTADISVDLNSNVVFTTDYETQTGAWADPSGAVANGDIRFVYNSTQGEYRVYIYMNSGWRSVEVS